MDPVNETATGTPAQDINSRIEDALYGSEDTAEPEEIQSEVVTEDAEELPEVDDTDTEEDEGSEDLEGTDEGDVSLAGYLGIDEEKLILKDDGSVSFNAVIDGESQEVALSELTKSFQLQGHVNNKSIALENERKKFEESKASLTADMQQRVDTLSAMTKNMESDLRGDFNNIDWDRLRNENPAEYTALRQDYADRAQKIQNQYSAIQSEGKRLSDEQNSQQERDMQVHLNEQFDKMVESNPTWSDPAVLKADMSDIRSFASDAYGFGDSDFEGVSDHRIIKVLQDAKAYRSGKKAVEVKKAKAIPKFQKPGAKRANKQQLQSARNAKAIKANVKKTGHVNDVAKLLESRM